MVLNLAVTTVVETVIVLSKLHTHTRDPARYGSHYSHVSVVFTRSAHRRKENVGTKLLRVWKPETSS